MTTSTRRPELDGLRTFAVLPVLVAHAWPELLPGGHLGVDVFFVLSGYLITGLLLAGLHAGTFSFREFYRKRMLRLMPAFFLVLFVTFFFSYLLQVSNEIQITILTGLFAAFSASNIYLGRTSDYFSPDASENPLLHTWSLSVEEQFYLVFPLILLLLWRRLPGKTALVLAVLAAASLLYAGLLQWTGSPAAHYSSPGRAWELLAGCILAVVMWRPATIPPQQSLLAAPAAWCGALLLSLLYIIDMSDHALEARLLCVLATLAMIWGLAQAQGRLRMILQQGWIVYIGLISYSLYLWHQPVMAFGRLFFEASTFGFLVATTALSFFLSILTYHLVEMPARHSKTTLPRALLMLVTGLILVLIFAVVSIKAEFYAARDQAHPTMTVHRYAKGAAIRECMFFKSDRIEADDFCEYGKTYAIDDAQTLKVAIWGDSHAGSLVYGYPGLERPYDILHLGLSGCPLSTTPLSGSRKHAECAEKHKTALRRILEDGIDVVVLHAKWDSFGKPEWRDMFATELDSITDRLTRAGVKTVLVTPVPIYPFSVPENMIRLSRLGLQTSQSVSKTTHMNDPNRFNEAGAAIAEQKNIPVVRSENIFCATGTCITSVDNLSLYVDDDHVGVYGARLMAIEIDKVIREMLELPEYRDHVTDMMDEIVNPALQR